MTDHTKAAPQESVNGIASCEKPAAPASAAPYDKPKKMRANELVELYREDVQLKLQTQSERSGECIVWTGHITDIGYGKVRINNTRALCHRLSYVLANGPIPSDLAVLHKCDNKLCINPDHLFVGTWADNIYDMVKKGRHNTAGLALGNDARYGRYKRARRKKHAAAIAAAERVKG